jgi:hypothetical protein
MAHLHLQFLLGFKVGFSSSDGWERVYESSDEGTCTQNIRNSSTRVHMHQKRKIALEIAAKIANVSPNYTKFWPFRETGRTRC